MVFYLLLCLNVNMPAFKEGQTDQNPVVFTNEQKQLVERLSRINESTRLSEEAKTQQRANAVREFVVKNPAQVTPQLAKSMIANLETTKELVGTLWINYGNFLSRNYNCYSWGDKQVKDVTQARKELDISVKKMQAILDDTTTALRQFVNATEAGKKPTESNFFKGYKAPTAEESITRAFQSLSAYEAAVKDIGHPLEQIGSAYAETKGVEENTKRFGAIVVGTTIAISGIWIGAALGVGMTGAAVTGGADSLATSQTVKGLIQGELLTSKEALTAVLLGAGLGAAGHMSSHLLHIEEVAETSKALNPAVTTAKGGFAAAKAAFKFGRASAKTAEVLEHGYKVGEEYGERNEGYNERLGE